MPTNANKAQQVPKSALKSDMYKKVPKSTKKSPKISKSASATICTRQEIQCLLYVGFKKKKLFLNSISKTIQKASLTFTLTMLFCDVFGIGQNLTSNIGTCTHSACQSYTTALKYSVCSVECAVCSVECAV